MSKEKKIYHISCEFPLISKINSLLKASKTFITWASLNIVRESTGNEYKERSVFSLMHWEETLSFFFFHFVYQHDLLPPFPSAHWAKFTHKTFLRSQQIVPWFLGMRNTTFSPRKWKIILECVMKLQIHLSHRAVGNSLWALSSIRSQDA